MLGTAAATPPRPTLHAAVREVCRLRHLSLRTEEAYWHWIRRFILFHHKRHRREMGAAEIRAFLAQVQAVFDPAARVECRVARHHRGHREHRGQE